MKRNYIRTLNVYRCTWASYSASENSSNVSMANNNTITIIYYTDGKSKSSCEIIILESLPCTSHWVIYVPMGDERKRFKRIFPGKSDTRHS